MTPDFLTIEEVTRIHERMIASYGGRRGVRDPRLLAAAVGMPTQTFDGEFLHEDIFEMAAAYAYHIAQDQPFNDGNKRAGLGAALAFLWRNGVRVDEDPSLERAMRALDRGIYEKGRLANLLRRLQSTLPAS
jgi:death on curing protein